MKFIYTVLVGALCLSCLLGACTQKNEQSIALYTPGPLLDTAPAGERTAEDTDIVDIALPRQRGTRPYTVRGRTYYPLKSAHGYLETGIASWYGDRFHGQKTSSGERYNQHAYTAAHRLLPLGSIVTVTNIKNGKSVRVRINDRGPFVNNRVIDLSRAAAEKLDMLHAGIINVRVQSVGTVPTHVERNGDLQGNFYIQVGSFTQADRASRMESRLKKKGYHVRHIRNRGRSVHSVQVGPWKDLFAAQHALSLLKKDFPRAYVMAEN